VTIRLEFTCPHCKRASSVLFGAKFDAQTEQAIPFLKPEERLAPKPAARKGYCAVCKHDAHGREVCRYGQGIGTTVSECMCTGKRSTGRSAPASSPTMPVPVLSRPESKVLTALVQRADAGHATSSRAQIRILTGYRPTGSFEAVLRRLREGGLADGELDALSPTVAGRAALGTVPIAPTGAAAVAYWGRKLGTQCQRILEFVCSVYPRAATRDEILRETQYQDSGSFSGALRKLCRLDLVVDEGIRRGGPYRASADLVAPHRDQASAKAAL
jgi:hypothetical protein